MTNDNININTNTNTIAITETKNKINTKINTNININTKNITAITMTTITATNNNSSNSNNKNNKIKMGRIHNPPSIINKENCKFLIMDAPTDHNLSLYIETLKVHNVKTLVRTCEPTYASNELEKAGMTVIDIPFSDGEPPSDHAIDTWLNIVYKENFENNRAVAIHCVAGLGRSPLLVAIALIEFVKMDALQSVELIRSIRKGAINQAQSHYLKQYKPHLNQRCCIIL